MIGARLAALAALATVLVHAWPGAGAQAAPCTSGTTTITYDVTLVRQECTIPTTGTYAFTVRGADGGTASSPGGHGAYVTASFSLIAGDTLFFLVGQAGDPAFRSTALTAGAGGGGASYIGFVESPISVPLLIVAAGGGGGAETAGGDGLGLEPGQASGGAKGSISGGAGGTGGGGGLQGNQDEGGGGGGAGYSGDGSASTSAGGGASFYTSGAGGQALKFGAAAGGFGGGGAGGCCGGAATGAGGGGGGYSGGGGGGWSFGGADSGGGGGGSSYVSTNRSYVPIDVSVTLGGTGAPTYLNGNGQITMRLLPDALPVPEPGSAILVLSGLLGLSALRWRRSVTLAAGILAAAGGTAAAAPCVTGTATTSFAYTGTMESCTIVDAGTYRLAAYGANGGTVTGGGSGGLGAFVQGEFALAAGQVLTFLVGGAGLDQTQTLNGAAGGGGGTFVVIGNAAPLSPTPLLIAGGGGGGAAGSGGDAKGNPGQALGTTAGGGGSRSFGGAGGQDGYGGVESTLANGGAGGGGLLGNGSDTVFAHGGSSFVNGGAGGQPQGNSASPGSAGGFGGGGAGGILYAGGAADALGGGGGGGGGYSGGGGGGYLYVFVGGGGGGGGASFLSSLAVTGSAISAAGANTSVAGGNGLFQIEALDTLPRSVPTPGALSLFGTALAILGTAGRRRRGRPCEV